MLEKEFARRFVRLKYGESVEKDHVRTSFAVNVGHAAERGRAQTSFIDGDRDLVGNQSAQTRSVGNAESITGRGGMATRGLSHWYQVRLVFIRCGQPTNRLRRGSPSGIGIGVCGSSSRSIGLLSRF